MKIDLTTRYDFNIYEWFKLISNSEKKFVDFYK